MRTDHFLGRCKRCKATARVTPIVEEAAKRKTRTGGVFGWERTITTLRLRLPDGRRVATHDEMGDRYGVPCLCGAHVEFQRIYGHKSEVKCGGKCRSARGHVCECSCEGANHGGGFAGL